MKRSMWIFVLVLVACGSDQALDPDLVFNNTPAPSPQSLTVEKIRDGEIWLSWETVGTKGVAFYIVYRTEEGQGAQAVDSTSVSNFRDLGLNYETEYTYFVTVVDQVGRESGPSQSVSGQPLNNLSPLAPAGLRATAHNIFVLDQLEILLDWDENVETDLSVYRLYRSTEPEFITGEETLLTEVVEPRFVDQDIEVGMTYYYQVTAVDRGEKESSPSTSTSDVPLPLPELMEPVEGELTASTPRFRWNPVPSALYYRVVVTTSPVSGEVSEMQLTRSTTAVFVGRSEPSGLAGMLQSGQIYYWKVIASTREDGTENSVSQVERFKIR